IVAPRARQRALGMSSRDMSETTRALRTARRFEPVRPEMLLGPATYMEWWHDPPVTVPVMVIIAVWNVFAMAKNGKAMISPADSARFSVTSDPPASIAPGPVRFKSCRRCKTPMPDSVAESWTRSFEISARYALKSRRAAPRLPRRNQPRNVVLRRLGRINLEIVFREPM